MGINREYMMIWLPAWWCHSFVAQKIVMKWHPGSRWMFSCDIFGNIKPLRVS